MNIRNILAGQYTPQQIDTIIANAKKLPYNEQVELANLLEQYEKVLKAQKCQNNFMDFVKEMWPAFISGRHHAIMADAFERVANGSCKRLIINLPPRHSKSEFSSYLLPAWYLGRYPDRKIIQTAHTAELAVGFGRKVRNLVGNRHYQSIFPGVSLSSDSKAAGRWNTNKGGEYFAIGVGGAVTGKGADCAYFSCKCLTRLGKIPISQVQVGDEVYGYDHESRKPKWTRVLAVSTQYKPELVSIGGFICTPDHRIYDGSGYARADQAHQFAMLPMWENLSTPKEGVREGSSPLRDGESSDALRAMSRSLSSNSIGICAEDLKGSLLGSGYWVVDIQTESENFFCEGVLAHNCLIIDDPHSEQEAAIAASNPDIYDGVYEWYTSGPRQRLQPGGAIVILMTRWSKRDLCGQILKSSAQKGGDQWEVIEFPAIMPSGGPLWPEFWSLEELDKIKVELPVAKWNAQYQQNPTSEEGALVKREWWHIWEKEDPPKCEYIIQSWDTALTKGTRSDYSACTTWGVFYDRDSDGKKRANIIILNAYQGKLEFPELKQKALEEYRYWKPDCCIIEAKAAGAPLVFELRKMGIPIQDYTPSRGNDKIVRVNAVSDIFASGFVYAPPMRWAEEVIEQFASFPNSDHDDLVDSSTQALLRFRQGGFISTQSDDDEDDYVHTRKADYY